MLFFLLLLLIRWIAVCRIIFVIIVNSATLCYCRSSRRMSERCVRCVFALKYFKSHIIANRSIYMFTHRVLWHFIARTLPLSLALSLIMCVCDSFGGRRERAKENWKQSKELTMSLCVYSRNKRCSCTLHVIFAGWMFFSSASLFLFRFHVSAFRTCTFVSFVFPLSLLPHSFCTVLFIFFSARRSAFSRMYASGSLQS